MAHLLPGFLQIEVALFFSAATGLKVKSGGYYHPCEKTNDQERALYRDLFVAVIGSEIFAATGIGLCYPRRVLGIGSPSFSTKLAIT
jgi:hypothetical protein